MEGGVEDDVLKDSRGGRCSGFVAAVTTAAMILLTKADTWSNWALRHCEILGLRRGDLSPASDDFHRGIYVGDITNIWTWKGWLFLATVFDLGSAKVVGWDRGRSRTTGLRAKPAGVIGRLRPVEPRSTITMSRAGERIA